MKLYEVWVGQEHRGNVEATDAPTARRIAREGGLWRRGEGSSTVLQRITKSTGKVTSRTAQDRMKTGQLGRKH